MKAGLSRQISVRASMVAFWPAIMMSSVRLGGFGGAQGADGARVVDGRDENVVGVGEAGEDVLEDGAAVFEIALAVDADDLVLGQVGQDLLHAQRRAFHPLLGQFARLRQLEQHQGVDVAAPLLLRLAAEVAAADLAGLQVISAEEDGARGVRDVDRDDLLPGGVKHLAHRGGHSASV